MYEPNTSYGKVNVTALLLAILCISGALFAQLNTFSGGQKNLTIAQQRLQTKVTYSCTDTPIDTALKELARQANIYIVKSPEVIGNVSIEVVDVPLEEVLTNLLGAHNYSFIATETMIRIVALPESATLREKLQTQIYKVTYADVSDLALALQTFVSDRGKIAINKGTSHIIVTDTEEQIKAIGKFIEEIDRMTPQVLVEVKIYDITSEDKFELESEWDISRNTSEITTERSTTATSGDYPTATTKTTTTSGGDSTTTIVGHEADDDFPVTGVFYDETTTTTTGDITTTETQTLPIGTYLDRTDRYYKTKRRKPTIGSSFDKKDGGTISFSLLNDSIDIDFVLSMLYSEDEVKLLANPRVTVLDNETATFETVREVPYTERTITTGGDAITSIQFKPVGVQLEVTPHITAQGMVRLKVKPEFGVVVNLTDEGAPTIDTRRTTTTTLVQDGQTIVLSGLRQKKIEKGVEKFPLLGDIPLLGGLFRAETEKEEISELVVFITTKIVTRPRLTEAEEVQLDNFDFLMPRLTEKPLRLQAESKNQKKQDDSQDPEDIIQKWIQKEK
jgi:type II secretory pathway component GspD/PulD (secretin)